MNESRLRHTHTHTHTYGTGEEAARWNCWVLARRLACLRVLRKIDLVPIVCSRGYFRTQQEFSSQLQTHHLVRQLDSPEFWEITATRGSILQNPKLFVCGQVHHILADADESEIWRQSTAAPFVSAFACCSRSSTEVSCISLLSFLFCFALLCFVLEVLALFSKLFQKTTSQRALCNKPSGASG